MEQLEGGLARSAIGILDDDEEIPEMHGL